MPPLFTIPPDIVYGPRADFLPLAGEINWGMELLGVQFLRTITDGAGVRAGVVDTGGTPDQHPLLARIKDSRDFTGSRYGASAVNPHGLHCIGTVAAADPRIGVATGCDPYTAKGLGDGGSGTGRAIGGGMRFLADSGCEVISMSLGSPQEDPEITGVMRELAEQGVWVVCAAGNSGPGTPDVDWPGRSTDCIDVAAIDRNFDPASFTSAGAKIDTAGPGVDIWSTVPGGRFQQMSGTSMATPFVAGVLTLYRAALKKLALPVPRVGELRGLLSSVSTDAGAAGRDRRTGPGWASAVLLSMHLSADPPPVGA